MTTITAIRDRFKVIFNVYAYFFEIFSHDQLQLLHSSSSSSSSRLGSVLVRSLFNQINHQNRKQRTKPSQHFIGMNHLIIYIPCTRSIDEWKRAWALVALGLGNIEAFALFFVGVGGDGDENKVHV